MENIQMRMISLFLSCFLFCSLQASEDRTQLMQRIWYNESKCSYEKLVWWNPHEEFPSLGIGHFIWFPEGKDFPYVETFPQLLQYMEQKKIPIPLWLKEVRECPWATKEEMEKDGSRFQELREFLFQTRLVQSDFIVDRLYQSLPKIIAATDQKETVKKRFDRIAKEPGGLFALIDYVHFKGEGIDPKERYQGEGWGLLQVLLNMPANSKTALKEFVVSAKQVLDQRIANAPSDRKEERWRKGWYARVDSYLSQW